VQQFVVEAMPDAQSAAVVPSGGLAFRYRSHKLLVMVISHFSYILYGILYIRYDATVTFPVLAMLAVLAALVVVVGLYCLIRRRL
jgi:hypothetical protein